MKNQEQQPVLRKNYTPPSHLISTLDLTFQLSPRKTTVIARSKVRANPHYREFQSRLFLYGEELSLISLKVDGKELTRNQYTLTERGLDITNLPEEFELEIKTEIKPDDNVALNGLYRSNGNYCTQCEAEGFRKITYFLDRPDVMAIYTTRIEGNKEECPVLLSNGNLIEKGEMANNLHFSTWHDPHPKPSYLFALVAGNLVSKNDTFVTRSQRKVALEIFVEPRNKDKCAHAMRSLKKAMKWDEETFGLEYDLDTYMIVAVDDFNMGAMENKGLNVFNSKYVLASPETATDQDYLGIEGVIAHEYFHNWTGNRVTCRDWFQLSLKEGLTVFRDQEFSSDMNSRPVQRIDDVNILRNYQFREDAGPMSHPVRPDSFVEINNFYTVTVYNKGAEVVRMIHTLLGVERFRKGMDLYFQRHDGQAVTCDDFVKAMSDASGVDLTQFKNWYSQSGTPEVKVSEKWDENEQSYSLTLIQSCPSTPGQNDKKPFHIPISIGLLGSDGRELEVAPADIKGNPLSAFILEFTTAEKTFIFKGVSEKPTLSFLRNFTAPVKVLSSQTREDQAFILANDSDLFNRWDAACRMATSLVLELVEKGESLEKQELDEVYVQAFRETLKDTNKDKALIAQALTLPTENYLAQQMKIIDPDVLHRARKFVQTRLRSQLINEFERVYFENQEMGEYSLSSEAMGKRSLKNTCLRYLMADQDDERFLEMCISQYRKSTNMTDVIGAIAALANFQSVERDETLAHFYDRWQKDPLVIDKWFILQATSTLENTLEKVKALLSHKDFTLKNPNKVRSLIGSFCNMNHVRFHDSSGEGYRFLAEQIIRLDSINPQVAARLVSPFTTWKRYEKKRQALIYEQLKYISQKQGLSNDVGEIVLKSL